MQTISKLHSADWFWRADEVVQSASLGDVASRHHTEFTRLEECLGKSLNANGRTHAILAHWRSSDGDGYFALFQPEAPGRRESLPAYTAGLVLGADLLNQVNGLRLIEECGLFHQVETRALLGDTTSLAIDLAEYGLDSESGTQVPSVDGSHEFTQENLCTWTESLAAVPSDSRLPTFVFGWPYDVEFPEGQFEIALVTAEPEALGEDELRDWVRNVKREIDGLLTALPRKSTLESSSFAIADADKALRANPPTLGQALRMCKVAADRLKDYIDILAVEDVDPTKARAVHDELLQLAQEIDRTKQNQSTRFTPNAGRLDEAEGVDRVTQMVRAIGNAEPALASSSETPVAAQPKQAELPAVNKRSPAPLIAVAVVVVLSAVIGGFALTRNHRAKPPIKPAQQQTAPIAPATSGSTGAATNPDTSLRSQPASTLIDKQTASPQPTPGEDHKAPSTGTTGKTSGTTSPDNHPQLQENRERP